MDQLVDQFLQDTLNDYRMSRSERRTLSHVLDKAGTGERQRELYRHRAFELARGELISPQAKQVLDWLEEVVKVLDQPPPQPVNDRSAAYFSPQDNCPGTITGLIGRTSHHLDVCVFTITDDRISDAIVQAHRRKVNVRVITDNDKSTDIGSDIRRLRSAGVEVREDRTGYHMHHKFALFDRRRLLTGSYNWTRSAAAYNEENFVVTGDQRLVGRFSECFDKLWKDCG